MHRCEDCGAQATVAMASVGINRPGQPPPKATEHRYCRPCAERHGVPPRPARPSRDEPKQLDWAGMQRFYEFLETFPVDDPQQRAVVRETVLQFREFLEKVPEPAPPELRELVHRLV